MLVDASFGIARVEPHPQTLRTIQDKFNQKEFLAQVHPRVPMGPFALVRSIRHLQDVAAEYGYPLMLKSRKMAYDGRGNYVLNSLNDINYALKTLCGTEDSDDEQVWDSLYAEKWVPYVKELAVMVAKGADGQVVAYPCVETVQKNNICHLVYAPAPVSHEIEERAKKISMDAVRHLHGSGVFGVELFLLHDGSIVLNEIAPRPHNSGHYTIEACFTSQYEQHLRAVTGLPLGSTELKCGASVMVNILGTADGASGMSEVIDICRRALSIPGASVHLYGKKECRLNRKMGHINIVGSTLSSLKILAHQLIHPPSNAASPVSSAPHYSNDLLSAAKSNDANTVKLVSIIMGSDSDLPIMRAAADVLEQFGVDFELTIVSAHRTPERLVEFSKHAHERGVKCIIAGAGGAAHLPGMVAALSPLPVIGVPVGLKHLDGVDSLYSIVQMPRGVPVACVAIDNATNAGLLAVRILSSGDDRLVRQMSRYQADMKDQVMKKVAKLDSVGWSEYSP